MGGITAFGAGQHITNCGKEGLSTPSAQDVVTDVQRGSIQKFDVAIDAHHAGHLEMRLCSFIIEGDDQDVSSCTLLHRASAAEAGVTGCAHDDGRDICAPIDPNNPEPEPEPESETGGATCKATPGLNRGVSDSACAQCAAGYKWWPCNEAELCECTGTALAQFG